MKINKNKRGRRGRKKGRVKNIWSAAASQGALASQPQTYRYKLVWNMSTSSDLRVCGSRQGFLLALTGFGVTFRGDGKRKKPFCKWNFWVLARSSRCLQAPLWRVGVDSWFRSDIKPQIPALPWEPHENQQNKSKWNFKPTKIKLICGSSSQALCWTEFLVTAQHWG